MIREVLSNYNLPLLTCVGLLIFLGIFVSMLIWVFRRGSRDIYRNISRLPLEELEASRFGQESRL